MVERKSKCKSFRRQVGVFREVTAIMHENDLFPGHTGELQIRVQMADWCGMNHARRDALHVLQSEQIVTNP